MTLSRSDIFPVAVARAALSPGFVAPFLEHAALHATSWFRRTVSDIHDHGNNAPTIQIIPGFTHTSLDLRKMVQTLAETHNIVITPELPWYTGSVRDIGAIVRAKSQQVLQSQEKNGELILLGHSLGGVVAIHSIFPHPEDTKRSGRSSRKIPQVARVYTIGSPHGGVPWAGYLPMIPVLREISDTVSLYAGLDKNTVITPVTTITLDHDSLVPPESQGSIHLPASLLQKRDIHIPRADHLTPLSTRGVGQISESTGGFTR